MLRDANPDWVFPNAFWRPNTKKAGHEQGQGKIKRKQQTRRRTRAT